MMSNFNYKKWINVENNYFATAISAIPAISPIQNSRNSKNSRTGLAELEELTDINSRNSKNSSSKQDENLNECLYKNHGVTIEKLKSFLGEDWDDYKDNPEALELWADLLFTNSLMDQGKLPDNFTAITYCNLCGYVYVPPNLTNGGNVLGCPWCWNRAKGLPIPKPADQLTC